ncbi:MAG: hypothetical protein IPH18_03590 [Chitinophagaceae bacterium]|nr:hypothetical protein [Chitinophagaceae bacterium]MBK8953298.1 hypothetical protein [Chitinophagaceae bacterium]
MSYTPVNRIGTDHTIWVNGLIFYKDEIKMMEARLTEVASKNTTFEASQDIEHFQNQFILQRNNIDELKHDVNIYVGNLAKGNRENEGRVESEMLGEKLELHERYEGIEKVMKELRDDFKEFLAKWM